MELCECGHEAHGYWFDYVIVGSTASGQAYNPACSICGCRRYKPRHDPAYDPDDVRDHGYRDEGYPYSGMGKRRR